MKYTRMNSWLIDDLQDKFPNGIRVRVKSGWKAMHLETNVPIDIAGVEATVIHAGPTFNPLEDWNVELQVHIKFDVPPPGFTDDEASLDPEALEVI